MLTHDNDPVGHFGIDMLLQRPEWLGTNRAASVPAEMSWVPGVSFMQSLLDALLPWARQMKTLAGAA